ncbi:hypothetical protein L226DRAFT_488847 [Lentinus tigrinus ALCF2SS1-7]|uniref:MYND-type domain-containing protein n=1 Tax=Lentinus tigrinus ALCF2SS1-6 TaxID=1328759 RepID=A0A5C2S7G6_9APHY|nr:hypothetical protein L227DRAFT_527888 [Lentinus tigrinus ALCF2SS1-6]RPD73584.1 hypothetical protein L226DRAFT_488847 [Lentinus tigrinus ALCF2SS1-7]
MGIESHPLQTTFRPGDAGELRNKGGRCRNCDRARKGGEQFSVCKGCKTAVYCSEKCQREHWKDHKDMCKYSRVNEELLAEHSGAPGAGMPNLVELKSLLRDFSEIHRPSFQTMLLAKLRLLGGVDAVLGRGQQVCLVPLKYREPGSSGIVNPALTFTYTNMVLLPLDRVLADPQGTHAPIVEGWNASASLRERLRGVYAVEPGFVDIMPVMFSPLVGPTQMGYFPVYRLSEEEPREQNQNQLELLSKFIEIGVVLRQPRPDKAPILGHMKDLGGGRKWEWRPLVDWNIDPEWKRAKTTKERVKLLQRKMAEAHPSA